MARHTYNCGGKGRYGKPGSGICSYCGRKHPKGKKQKEKSRIGKWESCSSVAARRKKES